MQYCKNVTLRERKLAHDKISLYLDYYPGVRDKVTMKITQLSQVNNPRYIGA